MARRGRPPYPEILTPREQEVHGLLRDGLSNPEIAERLGISLDGAKYHVSEILSKLGVNSREEAAGVWLEAVRPWWATAFAPVAFLWRATAGAAPVHLSSVALVVSSGLLVVIVGGLGLIAFLLMRGGGGSGPDLQPAGAAPSFSEVQQRSFDALSRPGQVFHTTYRTQDTRGKDYTRGVWLDADGDVARAEPSAIGFGGEFSIYEEESAWGIGEAGRFTEMPMGISYPLDSIAPLALDYLRMLFVDASYLESPEVSAVYVDGAYAVRVEFVTLYRSEDYEGRMTTSLYLDEAYLPMRQDIRVDASPSRYSFDGTVLFENEFVERASLPADFFSLDALRAIEVTPADDIARAVEGGMEVYWLGEEFEGMQLLDARVAEYSGGISVLSLEYRGGGGGPNNPPSVSGPPFGVSVTVFSIDGWQKWLVEPSGRNWWLLPDVERTPVELDGLEVTIYEDADALRPSAEPPPGSGPTPANLSPFWRGVAMVAVASDAALLIEPNIGPFESNPFRVDTEALARLGRALRPFEAPQE